MKLDSRIKRILNRIVFDVSNLIAKRKTLNIP